MKKVALVFVVAVILPSLVLAWLALRSLRDQQFLLERQQSLLDQRMTDAFAQNISDYLAQRQQEFSAQVESLAAASDAQTLAARFDDQLRQRWPLAEVGFCVTLSGKILSPSSNARPEAQLFRLDNSGFLGNRETAEVYGMNANANSVRNGGQNLNRAGQNQSFALNSSSSGSFGGGGGGGGNNASNLTRNPPGQPSLALNSVSANSAAQAPSQPRQQLKLAEQSDIPNAAAPPQEKLAGAPSARNSPLAANNFPNSRFGGGSGGGGGGGANNNDRNASRQAVTVVKGSLADSIPSAPQQKPELATAKELNAPAIPVAAPPPQTTAFDGSAAKKDVPAQSPAQNTFNYKAAQARKVSPQNTFYQIADKTEAVLDEPQQNLSKVIPAEAEFSQLIGSQIDGMLARFLQNKLKLMFWHRLSAEPDLIFGAQLNLNRVVDGLRGLIQPDPTLQNEICLALLDDNAKPVAISRANFQANWKRPFVATEIGDALPHWEVAAYLVNPARLTQAAHTAKLTLGLLIAVLVLAIGVGSWLIVSSLNSELKLARQKTDFVGNVSHELKTPLTSIRMFSELLAEQRVTDTAKQRSYLNIITAEAGRLTRLINNVLDFSRMERGEKKYNFQPCDLAAVVRGIEQTFRPHLEAGGFKFVCELPDAPISVRGDADALSQVIVNLLSNAEKYSNGGKEITIQAGRRESPLPYAEIKVLDRGMGIPHGSEEKVFEKFYRAHDSLGSGVQGSGLGLTIARQIARAHGGDVVYEPREGGGSCFCLRIPLSGGIA
jgi:signal transduction histidine kinase